MIPATRRVDRNGLAVQHANADTVIQHDVAKMNATNPKLAAKMEAKKPVPSTLEIGVVKSRIHPINNNMYVKPRYLNKVRSFAQCARRNKVDELNNPGAIIHNWPKNLSS